MIALKTAAGLTRGLALAGVIVAPAAAETIVISCDADLMFKAPEMTLVYEGEAEGTLSVTASFGEMNLTATMESREGTDETGEALSATGIRAFGPASLLMPDKATIEACIRGKLPPDQLGDSDIVLFTAMGCAGEAPAGVEPIAVNASAEIALLPDGDVYVGVTRTYAEPTELAGGTIALEAYPNCSIEE